MCDPLSIGAAVLTLAGTGATMAGQQQAQGAQKRVANAEASRQQAFNTSMFGNLDQSIDRANADRVRSDVTEASAKRGEANKPSATAFNPNTDLLSGQGEQSGAVRNAVVQGTDTALGTAGAEADAKARLGGWTDAFRNLAVDQGRRAEQIAMEGGFARASSNLLPLELQAAAQKGSGTRAAGSLLTGLGSVVGMGASVPGAPTWGDVGGLFAPSATAAYNNPGFTSSIYAPTRGYSPVGGV
jgi:hypothetical protein